MSEAVLDALPKLRGLQVTVLDNGVQLRRSQRQWGLAAFFSFWLTGWTVGCVFLLLELLREPQLFLFLFGLPFWSAWVFAVFLWANCLLNREEWRLTDQGLFSFQRWGFLTKRVQIPLEELQKFQQAPRGGKTRSQTIAVEAHGGSQVLTFGEGLGAYEARQVVETLEQVRRVLWKNKGLGDPEAQATMPAVHARLDAEGSPRSPSVNWSAETDFDSVLVRHHGSGHLGAIGGTLFVCLFWNGIVSVFVGLLLGFIPDEQPQGMEWWFLFLFLLPFELIGLVLIWAFLATLAAPFRRETWRFDRHEMVHRISWIGLGKTRTYEAPRQARIDFLYVGPPASAATQQSDSEEAPYVPQAMKPEYQVQLIDRSDVEICSISSLTRPEAEWLVNLLQKERPEYFR